MLLIYSIVNVLLCIIVACFGGWVGLYAMLAISFFMSIMYPTQFSLALKGLGDQTKSGSDRNKPALFRGITFEIK